MIWTGTWSCALLTSSSSICSRPPVGFEYAEASTLIEEVELEGVRIPFASPELLWQTKQTVRSRDELDRQFLANLIEVGRDT